MNYIWSDMNDWTGPWDTYEGASVTAHVLRLSQEHPDYIFEARDRLDFVTARAAINGKWVQ